MSGIVAQSGPVIPDFGEASSCVQDNRLFCPDWVRDNWGPVLQPALLQHVKLTIIAVAIGFVLAFVAALFARHRPWFERPFDLVSALVYTIPSIALFQLLVPVTGLTVTTVEVALVSYTLLILFRNFLTGFRSVPADVLEAARGMGMGSFQVLRRVELPLALPAIMAGVRIATVSTIALATVAAFVIPEGLGRPIFLALRQFFNTELIVTALLAIGLALVADGAARARTAGLDPVDAREDAAVIGDISVFGDALRFIEENPGLLWDKTVEQLELSAAAIGVALLVALPIGIGLGHLRRYSFVAINVANIGRALPTLAVIAVCIVFLPVGFTVVLIALVVLAVPPILTNAYVGVSEVDAETVEAARGMGMTERQILQRVELPLASPLLFAGIRTAVVFVVASATIAAIAGGGGLGDVIVNQASYGIEGVIGASILVSALAFACDGVVALVQRGVTPRPLRGRRVGDTMLVSEPGTKGSTL